MYRGWKSYRIWDQKLSAVVAFALVFLFNLFIRDAPVNFSRKKIRRRVLWPRIKRFLFYGYRNIYIHVSVSFVRKEIGGENRRKGTIRWCSIFFKFKKKKRYGRILAVLLIKTSILCNIFFLFFFFLNSIFFYTRILHIFQS